MNFLGKRVCIIGEFCNFRARGSNFQKEEMKFLLSHLGAIISDYKKADIIFAGEKPEDDKITFAKENNIPILEMKTLEEKVLEDEIELENSPEILKEIQEYLVNNAPKYLGRNVMNEYAKELLEKKIQEPKVSKTWIKEFYENVFISLPKEIMVAESGSAKAKEHGLDWILKNESLESYKAGKLKKMRKPLTIQNDDTFDESSKIKFIFSYYPNNLNYALLFSRKYRDYIKGKTEIIEKNITRPQILKRVQNDIHALEYASKELRADREIVLAAVQKGGYALRYASKELRANREIVLEAIQTYGSPFGSALEYASEELKNDQEFMLTAIQKNGCALRYATEELRADREIVLAAVQNNREALKYASEDLQENIYWYYIEDKEKGEKN